MPPFAACAFLVAFLAGALPANPARAQTTAPAPADRTLAEMTWMEARASIAAGASAVIVPTGGLEQNGPHMAIGKHDAIVAHAAREIARRVGSTLVAPTISFLPQGGFSPPSGNMLFPGTIGISEQAFEMLLDGVARSMRNAGFRTIFFVGDHGMSQAPQGRVARRLSAEWRRAGVRVIQIDAWYDASPQVAYLKARGETDASIGTHAGIMDTAELMAVAPDLVWLERLKGLSRPLAELGATGAPERASAGIGQAILELRIEAATRAIRAALASP